MLTTNLTRLRLAQRREERDMLEAGWERVGDNGGKLWELNRGARIGQKILEVKVAVDGVSLWVRVA